MSEFAIAKHVEPVFTGADEQPRLQSGKQGYDVAATIDCEPPGLTRYYMVKKL